MGAKAGAGGLAVHWRTEWVDGFKSVECRR